VFSPNNGFQTFRILPTLFVTGRFVPQAFRIPDAFRTLAMMTTNGSVVNLLLMTTGVWTVITAVIPAHYTPLMYFLEIYALSLNVFI